MLACLTQAKGHFMKSYRFPKVRELTGLSRSTIFRLERAGLFPGRRKLSSKAVCWMSDEIEAWLASREVVKGAK